MSKYEKYLEDMKVLGATKPYMNEVQFNEAFGIKEEIIPIFVASKNGSSRTMKPTLGVHNDKNS